MRRLRLGLVVWSLATAAAAGDGVFEINQATALAGGVSSCDTPGFPVTICASGSYRLTSNLKYVSAASEAIGITVPDVTLDLNGMTIQGDNSCSTGGTWEWVVSCTEFGSAAITGTIRTVVANGRILGAAGNGVSLGDASELRDVQVSGNAGAGASLGGSFSGGRSIATNVSAVGNGGTGVTCSWGFCVLSEVLAVNNGGYGIYTYASVVITKSVASRNRLDGITTSGGSELSDIATHQNGGWGLYVGAITATHVASANNLAGGIWLGEGSALDHFTANENGLEGVKALDGSLVSYGVLRSNGTAANTSYALTVQGGAGYRALVITSANGGNTASVFSGAASPGVNLGNNTCQGVPCP